MSSRDIRTKIYACWLGKAVGGTLGTPHEGKAGPLNLDFYDPVPTSLLPNDDLDLQVVWLHHLRAEKLREVTPEILSDAWDRHVFFPFDEYAAVRRNRELGLVGAAQGSTDNYFAECMGAAIRSEAWACIAPGEPARAAGFAWCDAVLDHSGEGVWAAVFHAALQSAAFGETDPNKLIDLALGYIPSDSRIHRAIRDTQAWWSKTPDWKVVRDKVVDRYATGNFTDVVCNLCFEIVGWYDGGGDFGRSICTAVNCGFDTDCTGATLGALLGIIDPDCIPDKWRAPIGERIVLSPGIVGVDIPRDLGELTDWTIEVARLVKDCTPAIGPISARAPEGAGRSILSIPAKISHEACSSILASESAPALTHPIDHVLGGGWSQWASTHFEGRSILLRMSFTVDPAIEPELMLFYTPRATAWVNGKRILTVTNDDLDADPMIAPSFHRAGPAIRPINLTGLGPHELIIGLERPTEGKTEDLVFGLANHLTHLWLTRVFPAPVPAASPVG